MQAGVAGNVPGPNVGREASCGVDRRGITGSYVFSARYGLLDAEKALEALSRPIL